VSVSGVGTGEESEPGSSRTLNRSPSGDDTFWVPPNLKRQASVCQSENADTSGGKLLVPLSSMTLSSTSPSEAHKIVITWFTLRLTK
jgi:hypothetical protein